MYKGMHMTYTKEKCCILLINFYILFGVIKKAFMSKSMFKNYDYGLNNEKDGPQPQLVRVICFLHAIM